MMSFDHSGHMAFKAEDQSMKTSQYPFKTYFIYSIHQGESNLWRLVKPRSGIIQDTAQVRASERLPIHIMDSKDVINDIPSNISKLGFLQR